MAKHYKVLILVFLSFIGLYYAFESIEFSELFRHIMSVNLFELTLAILILMLSCIIRAKRLKYIISPLDTDISTHHLFGATMIGYFGNGILFFRLGELLKAFSISQGNDIKTSESFGVVMLERVLDAITVFILLVLYNIVFKDQYLSQTNFDFSYGFDFLDYNSLSEIIKFTVVLALYLWSLIFYLKNTSEKNKTLKPIHTLIILASFIAIIIAVLAPVKNGNEIVFFMLPFSIIVANYIETVDKLWFKEMLVVLLILVPIINLLL